MSFFINGWKLEDYQKTLNECANTEDKPEQLELWNGDEQAVALDDLCTLLRKMNGNQQVSSCDAFIDRDDEYYFIEFKNQPVKNIETVDVQKKAFISPTIVQMLLKQDESFESISAKSHLYVVYQDDESDYYGKIQNKVHEFAKLNGEPLRFGLRLHARNMLYKEVRTIPLSVFNSVYGKRIFCKEQ